MESILIIDPDPEYAQALAAWLARREFTPKTAPDLNTAKEMLSAHPPDYLMVDPAGNLDATVSLVKGFQEFSPAGQVLVATAPENLEDAKRAFLTGALDYLGKPVQELALDLAVSRARQARACKKEILSLRERLSDLSGAHRQFEQLFHEVPCYITVQDKNYRITATNRRFKAHFGDELGVHCYEVYKHRDSPCPNCPVADTFSDGRRHQTEEVVTAKNGKQYHVLTWTAPLVDEKGRITQVMEMSTDITHLRQLQDHLSTLGLMLGSMSHGVKGMLTALDGGIYNLETGLARDDKKRIEQAHAQLADIAGRIKKQVLEILHYAKNRELAITDLDASEVFASAASAVAPKAEKHGVSLKADVPLDLGRFQADEGWLSASLVNMLENAVEACAWDKV
ncbi:MAG: PAS domain-containing protein, partial [Deltaproteobacteria bacterium]|nr:PAS domain-containing protein [Deltaproteobacteria bacterium]